MSGRCFAVHPSPAMDIAADQLASSYPSHLQLVPLRYVQHRRGTAFHFQRRRKPAQYISCSTGERGLQPKPAHRAPPPTGGDVRPPAPDFAVSDSYIGEKIENLVFFGRYAEALEVFDAVGSDHKLGGSTYDALVNACIGLRSVRGVKRVFKHVLGSGIELDQYLRNRFLLMHVKCGMMVDARSLFDEMPQRNLVSWNTLIGGLVDFGDCEEALDLFFAMWEELSEGGSRTFATAIRAASGVGVVEVGRQLHSLVAKIGVDDNIFVICALIDMYSKCGAVESARLVFDLMPEKTTVGWNTMIAGYALHGCGEEALSLYYEMQRLGVKMDHFTYSILVRICTQLASLDHAKQVHAGLVRQGFGFDMVANTALVDFYSKWGRMEDARHVFDMMPHKNMLSWNALIAGYGNHGQGKEAIYMFNQMIDQGMVPNHITFLAVLSACSYSGLIDEGWEIFECMSEDYNVKPRAMHYAHMIELLGREGLLDEAVAMIRDAPFAPTKNMWAALLTACRVHNNLQLGKFAAEKLVGLEPEKLGNYIVLLNVYNSSQRTDEAAYIMGVLKRRGLSLLPACSWIEIKKKSHRFTFGDRNHPEEQAIYQKVNELIREIKEHGYVQNHFVSLLPDVTEHEKEMTYYHSELLAIAFGIIHTSDYSSLQVVQGHRICTDCHTKAKLIALATKREIVVRDASRFHHFRNGNCSCGDYW